MSAVVNEPATTAGSQQTRRHVVVDPITRLEGHGKIDIFLDESGNVERAFLQIPELRGFEVFVHGRPVEEMPQITSRICGVCPTAHHMAATKALDDLFKIEPTPTARNIRELVYNAFMLEDHALHVYVLGGPDFIVGPTADKAARNIVGVLNTVGLEVGKRVIEARRKLREVISYFGGKVIHPVMGLPGGVSKGLGDDFLPVLKQTAEESLEFARFTLQVFKDIVLGNEEYVRLITSEDYTHRTYYMGLVDEANRVNFYDGQLRVVSPTGQEVEKFPVQAYASHIAEHVEPWSYIKFCYLRNIGWNGFQEGAASGVYAVAPLARLNAADGMATELAQEAYGEFYATLGPKPVHYTLANHWARVIEMLQAAETIVRLANDPVTAGKDIRNIPSVTPSVGYGVVEAPRGTLIHHYETDENGLVREANLIVATQNNAARIAMSVEKAARGLIHDGEINDGLLNMVEMAFRAYDPCHGCATHSLPGQMPLVARVMTRSGEVIREIVS